MIFFIQNKTSSILTLITSFLMLLFFSSCQNSEHTEHNIFQSFYYPSDEWVEGMVYEYQPVNNAELPVEYWYFRKTKIDSSIFMTGQYIDQTFTPRQLFNAEIKEHGAFITNYILYEYDSLGNVAQNPAEILDASSFPFGKLDSTSIYPLRLKWDNPTEEYPDGYIEIIRKRQLTGNATYSFKNQSYDCLEFQLNETVDDFNDGHLEKKYQGKELYAKNLGLIYYKKEIDENFVLEYELRDTFSMAKLEEKFKTFLSDEN